MIFSNSKFFIITVLIVFVLSTLSACGQGSSVIDELHDSNLVEGNVADGDVSGEVIHLASEFLVDIDNVDEYERYDYILGHEDFYFSNMFLQSRWNSLVNEINRSFGWGTEAYEHIRDNYDELWETLKEKLRSEIAVTFLAYQLGFEADAEELSAILENMESFIAESIEGGVDVDTLFSETFGTTQENWEIQVARQLASIAMVDSMWEEHPLNDEMIQKLKDDVSLEELTYQEEELEQLARFHHLDLYIIDLIQNLDIRWGSQPGDLWAPRQ